MAIVIHSRFTGKTYELVESKYKARCRKCCFCAKPKGRLEWWFGRCVFPPDCHKEKYFCADHVKGKYYVWKMVR